MRKVIIYTAKELTTLLEMAKNNGWLVILDDVDEIAQNE